MKCNQDCNQGRTCDCGEPYRYGMLDFAIAIVAALFAMSCVAYLIKWHT